MIIATKKGDNGVTKTLFGKSVKKSNDLFNVLGDIDELSSFIGLSKAAIRKNKPKESHYYQLLNSIQLTLINLMGELNCVSEDEIKKYIDSFNPIKESDLQILDIEVEFLQNLPQLQQKTWVLYGKTEIGAVLDVSSKICRRAERTFNYVNDCLNGFHRKLLTKYINRLSDLLYLMARYFDYIGEENV